MILVGIAAGCRSEPADPSPWFDGGPPADVVVLSIDTLNRAWVGPWGPAGAMPTLEAMAATGIRLADHRSCANWTLGAVLCAQTGLEPVSIGFLPDIGDFDGPLPDLPPTLPTLLPGRRSVFAGANHFFSSELGSDAGYEASLYASDLPLADLHALAIDALEDVADEPWVYHLHALEPHAPYAPPEAYLGEVGALDPVPWDLSQGAQHDEALQQWISLSDAERTTLQAHLEARYAAELRWLDDQVAEVLGDLRLRGLLDDALVVVWSDHGEGFLEHQAFGHGHALYDEETAAVALFWSDRIRPSVIDRPTTHADLVPTTLDLLGLPIPDDLDGIPAADVPIDRPRFVITDALSGVVQSVEVGGGRLHYWWSGIERYHDLGDDPGELVDRYDPQDPSVRAAWDLLLPQVEAARPFVDDQTPLDPGP